MDIAIKGVTFNMVLIVLLTIIIAMSLYYSYEIEDAANDAYMRPRRREPHNLL